MRHTATPTFETPSRAGRRELATFGDAIRITPLGVSPLSRLVVAHIVADARRYAATYVSAWSSHADGE